MSRSAVGVAGSGEKMARICERSSSMRNWQSNSGMTFAPTYASVTAGRHHPDTAASITVGYDAGMAVAAGFTLIAIIVIRRRPAT